MKPVSQVEGRAAVLPDANIDTDQIVPGRFMHRDRREGFGDVLFRDLRVLPDGSESKDFPLNDSRYRSPKILIAGVNFACGSSRECAVWALLDHGIESVVAISFSDIFRNNAVENGLLTVVLAADQVADLQACIARMAPCSVVVDLDAQRVTGPTGTVYGFDFDPHAKAALSKGQSKVDATLQHRAQIDTFERHYRERFPWAIPR